MSLPTAQERKELTDDSFVDGVGMLDAMIRRMEAEVDELRNHRNHLMMIAVLNKVPVTRMAEACGVSLQAVYQAVNAAKARDRAESK